MKRLEVVNNGRMIYCTSSDVTTKTVLDGTEYSETKRTIANDKLTTAISKIDSEANVDVRLDFTVKKNYTISNDDAYLLEYTLTIRVTGVYDNHTDDIVKILESIVD